MSKHRFLGVVLVALLALGGWVLAQQVQPDPKKADPGAGHLTVSPAGQSAVLLDTTTGKTWILSHSVDGTAVWLPLRRIDSEREAHEWLEREKQLLPGPQKK
jgi:hypothetical protein